FVPTIQLAEQLKVETAAVLLLKKLIKDESEVAFAHAEDELREEKVRQFRQRNIYCLLTTTILERGVTFPSVDVVVLQANHDVFDEAALVQISGRAGRAKDDPDGEVIFIHDGKTEALVDAVHAIKKMNLRAKTFYTKESER
ncbi:MAG: DNA/RNA helicase, partial [Bacillales bacterium]